MLAIRSKVIIMVMTRTQTGVQTGAESYCS